MDIQVISLADAHARELAAETTAAGKAQLQQQHTAERNAQQQVHQHQVRTMETHQSHERASNAPHHGH